MAFWNVFGIALCAILLNVLVAEARNIDRVTHDMLIMEKCLDKDFCFYPYDTTVQTIVDNVIAEYNITAIISTDADESFVPRQGDTVKEHTECKSELEDTEAYYIKDVNNDTRIVLQSSNFKQGITMSICKGPGKLNSSRHISSNVLQNNPNFYFSCEQKYVDYRYLVLAKDLTSFEFIHAKNGVPVSCACTLYYY